MFFATIKFRCPSAILTAVVVSGLLVLTIGSRTVFGHGSAIDVLVNAEGQLYPFLFSSGIPLGDPPEFNYFAISDSIVVEAPGFGVVNAANGLEPLSRIDLNVAEPLRYWDGAQLTAPSDSITIRSPDGIGVYTVDATSGHQTGMRWGIYPGTTFWDEHGVFLLNPNEAAPGVYGIWMELASPSYATSEPFLVPFLYDPDEAFTLQQIEDGIDALLEGVVETFLGDFNADQRLEAGDIDLLSAAVRAGDHPSRFDLTGDDLVNNADREFWVEDLYGTYFGDADLDGEFGSSDLILALQAGTYEDDVPGNAGWATGDWDGDGEFSTADLLVAFQAGAYEQGPRASVASVPEPTSNLPLGIGLLLSLSLLPRTTPQKQSTR